MHPEIDKLIDLALADGQITEKERNVILKKAAELGVDADEVEMILGGKMSQQISPKNTLLFNMYKRITVLKALATINPPYTSLKNINYLTRLRNLNNVLLTINSKINL